MNADHGARRDLEQLVGVDLNLLITFDVLVREQSVTRAAVKLGVTQSAVSHALRRLRELLDDQLMVRGGAGMVLTPRAEALVVPLRSGLLALGRALVRPTVFEPRTARRTFTITGPDLFDMLAMPRLLPRLRRDAPLVDLSVVPGGTRRLAERLESGELDVALVPRLEGAQPEPEAAPLTRRTLFSDTLACYLRRDHAALKSKRRLDVTRYAALSHALVSPSGEGPGVVDVALQALGLSRRIVLRMPHFATAWAVVAHSDLVLTAPNGLALAMPADLPVVSRPVPLSIPRHHIDLVWHERYTDDPGHRWLREVLVDVAKSLVLPGRG
jgi:DNA-binding transcriptional LysR family regulator